MQQIVKETGVTECICTLCLFCCTLYVVLSMFFRVWTSFNHLHIVILDITKRRGRESTRESERQYQWPLAYTIQKNKTKIKEEKKKSGICGCGSFVVPYFQPATFISCLHSIMESVYLVRLIVMFHVGMSFPLWKTLLRQCCAVDRMLVSNC